MRGSPLLPCERFPSVPKGTNRGWLLCALRAGGLDLFAYILTYLFSVLLAGLLSGPDRDVAFIFWTLALQSHALSHSAASLPVPAAGFLCISLTAFSFAILWAARGTKVPFSVPAFTCLLGFRLKCISTAVAQHKGA